MKEETVHKQIVNTISNIEELCLYSIEWRVGIVS